MNRRNLKYAYKQATVIPAARPTRAKIGRVLAFESMNQPSNIPPATKTAIAEPTPRSSRGLGGVGGTPTQAYRRPMGT